MPSQENIVHTTPANAPPALRIGIFFDGTGNDDKVENSDSFSNIKYLYEMHEGDGKRIERDQFSLRKFYQRGVGSESKGILNWAIDGAGNAGGYGAAIRFDNAIFYIEKFINEYKNGYQGHLPPIIELDIFGFSRGAAMARHFVNCIKQNYFDFSDPEINSVFSAKNIFINFLGIFDTVGSFNIAGDNADFGFSFHIKPSWIVKKAVHIYALNEYRWGFDLQALINTQDSNYPIDIINDNFIEIGLPGAHSDIGGGYNMNKHEQFSDNTFLACMALEKMAEFAIDNGVHLASNYKDSNRRSVKITNKSFANMQSSYNKILPHIEKNELRSALGIWREHIALLDIYKHNNKIKDLTASKKIGRMRRAELSKQKNIRDTINNHREIVDLFEKKLISKFSTLEEFEIFKVNYNTLYIDYMHRSHYPFNTTIGMGQQDADDNFWFWNKTVSDDRPHRDIFYNQYTDFELENSKRVRRYQGEVQQASPEFKVLKSVEWKD